MIWKQEYAVTLKITDDIEMKAMISATDSLPFDEEKKAREAKRKIENQTGLTVSEEVEVSSKTVVLIGSKEDPAYIAAKWLCEDGREVKSFSWNDYVDAVNSTGVGEHSVGFEEVKEKLKMVWMLLDKINPNTCVIV